MKLDHPRTLAAEIARLIESDPVAAAQVKEHLSQDRLADLLDLTRKEKELEDFTDKEVCDYVESCIPDADIFAMLDDDTVLDLIRERFTKAEVLAAFP